MGFNNQVEPHTMALELSVAFDNSGAEGWQCDWLSCLIALLLLGCACTSFLVCVAQHTTFQDFDMFSGLC